MQAPRKDLETMPLHSLPPIPIKRQQTLLQMDPEEAMAMMMMTTEEQLDFLEMPPEKRKEKVDQLKKEADHSGHSGS